MVCQEERRKDVVTVAGVLSSTAPGMKFRNLKKLLNTYAFVFQAVMKGRNYRAVRNRESQHRPPPEPDVVEAAELYLIEQAQRWVDINKIKALLPKIFIMTDKLGHERKISEGQIQDWV
jgi:hypothetical protein